MLTVTCSALIAVTAVTMISPVKSAGDHAAREVKVVKALPVMTTLSFGWPCTPKLGATETRAGVAPVMVKEFQAGDFAAG